MFKIGVERGYPEAEFRLSRVFSCDDVYGDKNEAFRLGMLASKKGCARAMYLVGTYYESGIGTEIDVAKSERCFFEAAKLGVGGALKRLKGTVYEKEFKKPGCSMM